jgi:hypothetical protein
MSSWKGNLISQGALREKSNKFFEKNKEMR